VRHYREKEVDSAMKLAWTTQKSVSEGLSLVELLTAMALLALISLSISNFLVKASASSSSGNMRLGEASEIQMLIADIQTDLRQGASISDNSYNQRLEYTTYDAITGVATKKIYRITTISGYTYLQLSTDGGTNWVSPYRVSNYNTYILKNTPKFLYSWAVNNCTDFADSSGNGIWTTGVDTPGAYLACTNGTTTPALSLPSQATKVDLQSFLFSTGKGSPEATRSLPTDLFISVKAPLVRSNSSAVAGVKDAPLVHTFVTNTANSLFTTTFDVQSVAWDPSREQLIVVGDSSIGTGSAPTNKTLFVADRKGVVQNKGLGSSSTSSLDSVAVKTSGTDILALDATTKILYGITTTGTTSWTPSSSLNLGSPSNLINSPTGIAFDASTPSDFYIVGTDPATSGLKIYERNISTGALVGSAWALPAAFDASHPPGGMAIEPVNGDFVVVRNYVNGTSPNKTIDIYIISRAAGTSTYFSVNIDDLGSTTTGTAGNWGIGYDAANNRIFLSDTSTDKIYEVIPSQLISPRS
jgi:hypothetical protein